MMDKKIPLKDMKGTFEDKSIVSFLDDAYGISNSIGTKEQYKHTLISFNRFCLAKYDKDLVTLASNLKGRPLEEVLEVFKEFKRHLDVKINQFGNPTSNGTKRLQIGIVKKYLRSCGIKIHQEDIADCITIGRKMKVKKYPLTPEIVCKIIDELPRFEHKALTILLASTGMRKGEAVSLHPSDFDFTSNPVSIHISAPSTKIRQDRIVYLTKECSGMIEQLINKKPDKQRYLFGRSKNPWQIYETYSQSLRSSLRRINLYKILSNGFGQVTVHSFRQFFRTYAGHLIGRDFAESFIGHSFYLSEYENMPEEERKKIFLQLEPHMTFLQPKIQKPTKTPEVIELEGKLSEMEKKLPLLMNEVVNRIKGELLKEGFTYKN